MNEQNQPIMVLSGANELLLAAVNNESRHYYVYRRGLQHNEHMVSLCQQLLKQAQLKLQELAALAVDLGPGSFTGQRISLSFFKGLGFALGRPLLGFDTFSLWRHSAQLHDKKVPMLVLIDGRKRRFYARLFTGQNHYIQKNAHENAKMDTWDLSSSELYRQLLAHYSSYLEAGLSITGPGAPLFLQESTSLNTEANLRYGKNLNLYPPPDEEILASSMLQLAQDEYRAKRFMKASDGPLYLRKSDAEERV